MAVREGILALLEVGPTNGYRIRKDFDAATGGAWRLNVGQVYTTLDRLLRDGLVDATQPADDDARSARLFELTEDGRAELGEWWRAVPSDDPPPRDELMLKVLLAIEHHSDRAQAVIDHHRAALLASLADRRRSASPGDGPAALAERLVEDALVVRAEADLRWLDLCEARLANVTEAHEPNRSTS